MVGVPSDGMLLLLPLLLLPPLPLLLPLLLRRVLYAARGWPGRDERA